MDSMSNLMDFSLQEDEENQFRVPPLAQTPVVKNSILKPSTKDNLIQLSTPIHKNLKVKFQTPQTAKKVTPTRYENIRQLDDQENWGERTAVVFKADHDENVINAQAILLDLLNECIDRSECRKEVPVTSSECESNISLGSNSQDNTLTRDVPEVATDSIKNPGNVSNDEKMPQEVAESPPIVPKGDYSVDFDNLDAIDPFKTSGGISCSPSEKSSRNDNIDQSENITDMKLEDIDLTLSEIKLDEDADVTVIENKHSVEADETIVENKSSPEADVTVIENKDTNDVHSVVKETEMPTNEKSQMYDFDLDNIKDPFATKVQLANSPQILSNNQPENAISESETVKENPFEALKTDFIESDSVTDVENPVKTSFENCPPDNSIGENPFQAKSKVVSSPAISSEDNPFATKYKVSNSPEPVFVGSEENPFETQSKIPTSPAMNSENDPFVTKSNVPNSPKSNIGSVDNSLKTEAMISDTTTLSSDEYPFATVSKVPNSPTVGSEDNPFATVSKVPNSPAISSEENPFATKAKVPNSPSVSSEENPFATKANVPNSPAISSEENAFVTKTRVPNSPAISSQENPFVTKEKVPNSPAISSEENPLATKSKIPNSPTISSEENPLTTKSKVPNSPTISSVENPFATVSKVPNSPAISSEENPFATKSKVPSSPSVSSEENPFATVSKVPNSPSVSSEENPFVTKSKVPSSPSVSSEENPFVTKSKVTSSPSVSSEENPFATKSKVPNSPTVNAETDPFATKSKVPSSPSVSSEENPFVTKSKVPSSPTINSEDDPFATKSKVPSSPSVSSEENPFVTKSKVPSSPTINSEDDPFATKSKVPSSPSVSSEENPFVTKSKVPSSPSVSSEKNPFVTKSKVPSSPTINSEDNPFATKSKVPSSPSISNNGDNPFATKGEVQNTPNKGLDSINPFATNNKVSNYPGLGKPNTEVVLNEKDFKSEGLDGHMLRKGIADKVAGNDIFSPQFLAGNINSKRGVQGPTEKPFYDVLDVLGLGIDEDQFKPASEVFNDTAAWDVLENYGSSSSAADSSSALSRQSLYVKFDPLVSLPINDPRRTSQDFRRASMKLERLRELNADESFLLFGTPPKTSAVRSVGIVPQITKKKTPVKTPVQEVKKLSSQDLLCDSPDILSMSIDVKRLGETAEGLKMNMADIQDDGIVEVLKYTDADLKKMQHTILMEVQGKIFAREREFELIKQQYEKEIEKNKEDFKKELVAKEKKAKNFDELMVILTEYEKTINVLVNDLENVKNEKNAEIDKLKQKIEQLSSDEQSVESAFSDLHRRYEKMRTVLQGYKTNEETVKKYLAECSAKVKTTEEKMLTLRKDFEAKLSKSMAENETLKSEIEAESSKSKIALKRKEMELQGLQNQLEQKVKENTELTNLCDELLAKVK